MQTPARVEQSLPTRERQDPPTRQRPIAPPKQVVIPAIGVRSPLVKLGLNPDRSLEVPADFSLAGWYRLGPRPGAAGPAVIAGHVDSRTGPAVFYRLDELRRGDRVTLSTVTGQRVRFAVQRVERHPKDAFPTRAVYGPTRLPTLRLITCGGTFDHASGHYRDNVIVFARASGRAALVGVSSRPRPRRRRQVLRKASTRSQTCLKVDADPDGR